MPINSATGMVRPIVTVPHGLDLRALTTTRASTASSTIMMPSTATSAVTPATGPISSRAICPSDLPLRGADERARSGDRGEVMPEDDPFVGRHEVAAIVEANGGRWALGVEREHLGRNQLAVEAIRDEVA